MEMMFVTPTQCGDWSRYVLLDVSRLTELQRVTLMRLDGEARWAYAQQLAGPSYDDFLEGA